MSSGEENLNKKEEGNEELEEANIEKAIEYGENMVIKTPSGEPVRLFCAEEKDLMNGGIGLELYFKYMRQLVFILIILTGCSIPLIIINVMGNFYKSNLFTVFLAKMSIGNQPGLYYTSAIYWTTSKDLQTSQNIDMNLNVFLDIIYTLSLIVIVFFFERITKNYVKEISKERRTPGLYTVQIFGLSPGGFRINELKSHFEKKFGPVYRIEMAYNYSNTLNSLMNMKQITNDILRERVNTKQNNEDNSKLLDQLITQRTTDLNSLQQTFQSNKNNLPIDSVFVSFEEETTKIECIDHMAKYEYWCCCLSEEVVFQGQHLHAYQAAEPEEIIWENFDYTSCSLFFRTLCLSLILLVITLGSFFALIFIQYYQIPISNESDCSAYSGLTYSKASTYSTAQINCLCSSLSSTEKSSSDSTCSDYNSQIIKYQLTQIGMMIAISFLNAIISKIVEELGIWLKPHSISELLLIKMKLMTGADIISMTIYFFIVNLKFGGYPIIKNNTSFFGYCFFSGRYSDLDRMFFSDVGVSIVLMLIFCCLFPHLLEFLLFIPITWLKKCLFGPHRKIQEELNELYEGPDFYIASKYASLNSKFFVFFLFAGGIPLAMPLMLIYVCMQYAIDKFMVSKYCKKPTILGPELCYSSYNFIPIAIICHIIVGFFIYTSNDIYITTLIMKTGLVNGVSTTYYGSDTSINRTQGIQGVLMLFLLGIVVTFYISKIVIPLFFCSCKCPEGRVGTEEPTCFSFHEKNIKKYMVSSYDLAANPYYLSFLNEISRTQIPGLTSTKNLLAPPKI